MSSIHLSQDTRTKIANLLNTCGFVAVSMSQFIAHGEIRHRITVKKTKGTKLYHFVQLPTGVII